MPPFRRAVRSDFPDLAARNSPARNVGVLSDSCRSPVGGAGPPRRRRAAGLTCPRATSRRRASAAMAPSPPERRGALGGRDLCDLGRFPGRPRKRHRASGMARDSGGRFDAAFVSFPHARFIPAGGGTADGGRHARRIPRVIRVGAGNRLRTPLSSSRRERDGGGGRTSSRRPGRPQARRARASGRADARPQEGDRVRRRLALRDRIRPEVRWQRPGARRRSSAAAWGRRC